MKKHTREELNAVVDRQIDELRALSEFTGIFLSESADEGAFIVVQLHPMADAAKERVRALLADCPVRFRNIAIAEAH